MRIALGLALTGFARDSAAHAFAQRYDLPLPLGYYLAGAGAAVALSFIAAALAIAPREGHAPRRIDWAFGRRLVPAARVLSVTLLLVLLAAGFVGREGEPTDNLLPVAVWVLWWVGFTLTCALVADLWAVINPFAALARAVLRRPARYALPARLGAWPAVAGLMLFVGAELVWHENAVPHKLAWAVLLYAALTWVAMGAFGVDAWLARGDPFSRYFALVGRFAPLDAVRGRVRFWGTGLAESKPASASETAFIALALASVSFDGFAETEAWNAIASLAARALYVTGILGVIGNAPGAMLVKAAGLIAFALALVAAWRTCAAASAALTGGEPLAIARRYITSLVPIAIGYHFAHYLPFLLINGQAAIPLASDPFGLGWNLFGTRAFQPDLELVSARFIWNASVVAIVLGHVFAVVVAHRIALAEFGDRARAARSQLPMLAGMVGYTVLSLWILSQPLVRH